MRPFVFLLARVPHLDLIFESLDGATTQRLKMDSHPQTMFFPKSDNRDALSETRNATSTGGTVFFYGAEGSLGLLSNYALCPVFFDGELWPSGEHAYQAAKFDNPIIRETIKSSSTAKEAALIGRNRSLKRRKEWCTDKKIETMMLIQVSKFSQNAAARDVLLSTGKA